MKSTISFYRYVLKFFMKVKENKRDEENSETQYKTNIEFLREN